MKKIINTKCLLVIICLISISPKCIIYAQQNLETKIDSLLLAEYPSNAPGGVFLIAKKGNVIYKKSFGLSNLELNTPMNTNNVFEIGSMTKQFTAMSILMLKEKGKLNLNDKLIKYFPSYPNGEKITIHNLLTHTSGIKDFTTINKINEIAKNDLTPKELIDFFKNEPMEFDPGEKFKYSNSGYIILGYIIEIISGNSYAEFVEQQIFNKLNMKDSYYASHNKVINNRASGYHKKDDEYTNNRYISFSLPYASGSLMSTVDDLFKWQEALKNNLIINKETSEIAFTNYTLNNGEGINYGYGWHIKTLNDAQIFEHGGSIFGFKSMGVYLPELDIYVIGLTNCDCNSPTKITRKIAEFVNNE